MKSYTDLEQSKKLAEILPHESADMYYSNHSLENYYSPIPHVGSYSTIHNQIPCWSLAALLSVLNYPYLMQPLDDRWLIGTWYKNYPFSVSGVDNPVDACVEMIIKLHKLNLL